MSNIVQNYLVTIMHGDFSLYEVRLFTRIVMQANEVLKGKPALQVVGGANIKINPGICRMHINVRDMLSEGSHDYQAVKDAATSLMDKKIEFYNRDTRKWEVRTDKMVHQRDAQGKWIWRAAHLIDNVEYRSDGVLSFNVSYWLMNYILDFIGSNFSMYDFECALSLTSAYAIRMYWLTCSLSQDVKYPITMLRDMFGTGTKYPANKDFVKRCIEGPRKMLEEKHLNGYSFSVIGRAKRAIVVLHPIKRQERSREQLTAQLPIGSWINPAIKNYLTQCCGMSLESLEKNKWTIYEFAKIPDCELELVKIAESARKIRAGVGYYINAFKAQIKEHKKDK